MNDRPLLFRPEMVRALLDGRKTQTRRPAWRSGPLARVHRERDRTAAQRIKVGDLIWVKENWRCHRDDDALPPRDVTPTDTHLWFEADHAGPSRNLSYGKLRPSLFMPRWASRLTLAVTGVKIERLQDITNADALAEGVQTATPPDWNTPRMAYRALYQSIHGDAAWDANPEVVAITFTVHKANIDAFKTKAAA